MAAEGRILRLLGAGLFLIATAGATAWFFANFERQTQRIPAGASAQARRNPFLAAERFLARLGIPAESRSGRDLLRHPPPLSDTLVIKDLGPLAPERAEALRAWIEAGGHLVVQAGKIGEDEKRPGGLLDDIGIRPESVDPEPKDPNEAVATLVLGNAGPVVEAAFSSRRALEVEEELLRGEAIDVVADGHTRMVEVPLGQGWLTVVGDGRFMTNEAIGERDHALLLAHLAAPREGGKVWLIYDSAAPWLGALLWAAAPGALIAGATLVAVWLWSLGARLGPLASPPDRRRRDLAEHLEASGAFLWRRALAARLVAPTRKRVLAAWQRHRPELRRLRPQEQAATLAQATGEPEQALLLALLAQADDARAFVEQARLLQGLWLGARPGRQAREPRSKTQPPRPREKNG